jgi:hypothetical protein
MVSLQEQRLENQERETKEIQTLIEMRRVEHNNDIKDLHSRITTVNRELSEKIEETEKAILAELLAFREEMKAELKQEKKTVGDRIKEIEVWKYTVGGAIIAATWFLAKIDITKFFR